jgi:hypothetical protein
MGRALKDEIPMTGTKPTRRAPDGFTKWLRSGSLLQRWWKETLVTSPVVAIMIFYEFIRHFDEFLLPQYLVVTVVFSAGIGIYFAFKSMKKYPDSKAVLDPTAPEFGAPIEPN